jgi:4'-phosphopantetheinyl transferase EntD
MLERLLPSAAVVVEAFADDPAEEPFPGEEHLVAKAVPVRRREFVTARRCAREALGRLGFPPAEIPSGAHREPVWPAGVVGSITHCAGYRAAVVARRASLASVGVDAEPHVALPEVVRDAVTVPAECDMLDLLAGAYPATHWGKLLFSAKESIYKAWFPLTRRWLGFQEACLTIDPQRCTFTAELRADGTRLDGEPALTALHGRFVVAGGLVVTAVHVPVGESGSRIRG